MSDTNGKISSFKEKLSNFLSNKKLSIPTILVVLLIVIFAGRSLVNFVGLRYLVPSVSSANFSIEYRKIPFDAKTLEISFNTELNPSTINTKNVVLNPFIDGKIELKSGNTIVYNLGQNMKIGDEYSITIKKEVESKYGVKLGKDYTYIFEAISGAKVTKILPENTLNNISQNVIVLFNIPMIPLTTLENQDKLPCPIEITPKVEGKCKWSGGNVMEFVPKTHFAGSTEYTVKINSVDGLQYPIKEPKEIKFKTPKLAFTVGTNFSPDKGIPFIANFPIDPATVGNEIILTTESGKIPAKLESIKNSETRFLVKPLSGELTYSKVYRLAIPNAISPKYGNIKSDNMPETVTASSNFLKNATVFRKVLSDSGTLITNQNYQDSKPIPTKNVYFSLNFDNDVNLDKSLFSFTSSKGKNIDFDLNYGVESTYLPSGKMDKKESKKMVELVLKNDLDNSENYTFKILKSANKNLEKNIEYYYKTADAFKILGVDYISNTEACAYFNYDFEIDSYYSDYSDIAKKNLASLSTVPESNVRGFTRDYEDYRTKQYKCPQKIGYTSYIINTRLEQNKSYSLNISKDLVDKYGDKLSKNYAFKIQSQGLSDTDKFIYTSFKKDVNVIPSSEPTIVDIQGVNLDKATIEVCELDVRGYYYFNKEKYVEGYNQECTDRWSKEIDIKNKNWSISNNKIDIEKDIVGKKIESPVYLIRSTLNGSYRPNEGKNFSNVIIKSNLSVTLEEGTNKKIVYATSFDGKEQPSDLSFKGYTYDSKNDNLIDNGKLNAKWDSSKKVYELDNSYDVISVRNGTYYGLINKYNDSVSNYDFKYISGQDSSLKDYLYLFTERPIYKPGDTAYFKGILRKFDYKGYTKSDVTSGTLKILNENNEFFKDVQVKIDKNSNFSGKFELPKEMKTGRYSFEFYSSTDSSTSIYNDGRFYVEEYKKPTFKVNFEDTKKDVVLGDKAKINFNAEYYFGGRLQNTNFDSNILAQNYFFDAKDYSDYRFGTSYEAFYCIYWGECNYSDETIDSGSGRIDSNGTANIEYNFPSEEEDTNKNPNGEKIYSFNVTVTDPDTGKQVTKAQEMVLHNTDAYIGIKADYFSTKDKGIRISGIILNHNAKPASDKKATVSLIKKEWKNIKKQGVDGVFYNDYEVVETEEGKINVGSDSNGEFSDTLMPKSDGDYEVRATYVGANGKKFVSSQDAYIMGNESKFWYDGNNTVTDLVADKTIMKVGETANFTLKSPVVSGKVFVVIEKDDGILDYFSQDIKSTGERISVPIKDNYYPNFYVKAFLIGKNGDNPIPLFKRALSAVKLVTDFKKINVSIKPERNHYLPGEAIKLTIKATDEKGKGIAYANGNLSVVDESLLALKGNPKKNPFAFFYDMKRYLGVDTFLSVYNLVEKLEIKDVKDGEKGGAGEGAKGGNAKKKRGVFKDTAFWQADYTTDASGNASITTEKLPDNLTTWVLESVVSTTAGNLIGVGETTIITNKKLMISENTPRFLGSEDTINISPVIFNKTGKNSDIKVTISGENIDFTDANQTVTINNGAQKTVKFIGKVKNTGISGLSNESSKITIKATSVSTNDSDEVEKILPINETSSIENVATIGKTDALSFTEKIDLTNIVLAGAKLVIKYSPTLMSNLTTSIDFLANFPYGCLEQKQSAIIPNIYIKKLYDSIKLPFDLKTKMVKVWENNDSGYKEISEDEIIKNYIAESQNFQRSNYGFSYWADYGETNFVLTSIVVKGMSEIRSIGYTINDNSIKNAIKYLKTKFYANIADSGYSNNGKFTETQRLEAIQAIQSYDVNDYETYKMWKLLDLKIVPVSTKIKEMKVISNLLKNKSIGESEKKNLKDLAIKTGNQILADNLIYNTRGAFLGKDDSYTRVRNTSEFIGAVSDLGAENFKDSTQIIDNMIRWTISQKANGSFGSTQDTSVVIENLTKYIITSKELDNIKSNIKIKLNSEEVASTNIDEQNKLNVFEKILDGSKLKEMNDMVIEKQGNSKVYYDMSLSYKLPVKNVKARDEGFYIKQTYFDYNDYKKFEALKKQEYDLYLSGELDYDSMKYDKDITEYIKPVTKLKVGQLILVNNKIVSVEPRDQVAIEGFIPSGSEIINTNLDIENKSLKINNGIDREEFRDDRYFGYKAKMDSGIYEVKYMIRITHEGIFNLKPTKIFEFYTPEIFGQESGKIIEVKN